MLCEITVGVVNIEFRVSLFQTLKERPTHDAHEGFCFERLSPLDFEFDLPSMESLVTGLAQRDEIVRRIAPGPSALNVVNIEYRIFGLPTAVLTNVSVPKKHVFPHVPKSELLTLLVRRSGNVRGLQQCVSNTAVSTVMAVPARPA